MVREADTMWPLTRFSAAPASRWGIGVVGEYSADGVGDASLGKIFEKEVSMTLGI